MPRNYGPDFGPRLDAVRAAPPGALLELAIPNPLPAAGDNFFEPKPWRKNSRRLARRRGWHSMTSSDPLKRSALGGGRRRPRALRARASPRCVRALAHLAPCVARADRRGPRTDHDGPRTRGGRGRAVRLLRLVYLRSRGAARRWTPAARCRARRSRCNLVACARRCSLRVRLVASSWSCAACGCVSSAWLALVCAAWSRRLLLFAFTSASRLTSRSLLACCFALALASLGCASATARRRG